MRLLHQSQYYLILRGGGGRGAGGGGGGEGQEEEKEVELGGTEQRNTKKTKETASSNIAIGPCEYVCGNNNKYWKCSEGKKREQLFMFSINNVEQWSVTFLHQCITLDGYMPEEGHTLRCRYIFSYKS